MLNFFKPERAFYGATHPCRSPVFTQSQTELPGAARARSARCLFVPLQPGLPKFAEVYFPRHRLDPTADRVRLRAGRGVGFDSGGDAVFEARSGHAARVCNRGRGFCASECQLAVFAQGRLRAYRRAGRHGRDSTKYASSFERRSAERQLRRGCAATRFSRRSRRRDRLRPRQQRHLHGRTHPQSGAARRGRGTVGNRHHAAAARQLIFRLVGGGGVFCCCSSSAAGRAANTRWRFSPNSTST